MSRRGASRHQLTSAARAGVVVWQLRIDMLMVYAAICVNHRHGLGVLNNNGREVNTAFWR